MKCQLEHMDVICFKSVILSVAWPDPCIWPLTKLFVTSMTKEICYQVFVSFYSQLPHLNLSL